MHLVGGPATFVHMVEVGFLAHGGQQVQHIGVDANPVIIGVLPGVVLDHAEQLSNKEQDPMLRMILAENHKGTCSPV